MPHLTFTRDRRGYENTFLVHALRGRGRGGPQILYWFRSPPHVKVGRAALDEDAIRELQEQYPEIDFDWDRILQAKPPAPVPDEQPRGRGRLRERRRDPARVRDQRAPAGPGEPAEGHESLPPAAVSDLGSEEDDGSVALAAEESQDEFQGVPPANEEDVAASPVERALGSAGLSRVRARYAEVLARIHAAPLEPDARARVLDLAEQLNPDAWVTPAQIQEGVSRFERVLAEIGACVGSPRRRTRRGGRRTRRRPQQSGAAAEARPAPLPDASSDDDAS
jgi:hypothetical protein